MPPTYPGEINYDQATFLGFALEAIFYGINLVLVSIALVVLWGRKSSGHGNTVLILVTCWMFSLCTTHFGLNFNNVYNGTMVHIKEHISEETHLLAGADMIFSITDWCSQLILKVAGSPLRLFIQIYRCYLVWGRNIWVVVLPILISLATVSCGVALIGLVLTISPTAAQAPAAIVPIGKAGFSLSLILNCIVSGLIVYRIWYISRENRVHGILKTDTTIQRAIGIIVESGLLFLAIQLVFLVLFSIKHPAQDLAEPIATQIYGISPTLIIVRVGLGAAFDPSSVPATNTSLRFSSSGSAGGGGKRPRTPSKLFFRSFGTGGITSGMTGTTTTTQASDFTRTTDRTRTAGPGEYELEMHLNEEGEDLEEAAPSIPKAASSLSLSRV
ncbi:hypothetical protein FB45DRAFT_862904 [Roridomyces roridus]|uniref:Uncharacterized protein n=1 Tax=Roridomyces roridus TaxID=1738132 RepID=A0AAD7C8M4_9AGAR|nr:hypothetical protein FB45DRAFT_862904 [Roridomyces roridus]